ncbi:uncharacterized protein HMPREF1541_03888 [Cyphellophora europaea CBS 101466]|uniref:SnoaL-like domain-containing protein n=1 Tax=Cyphellophora europaea (strain CBS 101466) TaxID=1220924 RepID=W2S1X6_CYPE1|nr:uncharacterized protein HMPREF1541_03888 [Cyphellophora europaea CBS 101466]ETN41949.1 hypothetical protein HMPREF1541_03888 [Cyphellophora europaea CBS 101466]
MANNFSAYKLVTPASVLSSSSPASITLSEPQQLLTASVLDLFAGHPSKRKLTLWTDDASFHDPLTNATGRKEFEAQWYGLKAAFSEIERLGLEVKGNGNPVELGLKTRYKVKGVGSEQTIESQILIHTVGEGEQMRIKKVEDKWDGEIKQGGLKNALRELNSKSVPLAVSVPKSVEEEESGQ